MTIYICRLDDQTFWTEAECHYHVDLHHPEWGHGVCVKGTPTPFQCLICDQMFETITSCEQHISTEHAKAGDLSGMWKILYSDTEE